MALNYEFLFSSMHVVIILKISLLLNYGTALPESNPDRDNKLEDDDDDFLKNLRMDAVDVTPLEPLYGESPVRRVGEASFKHYQKFPSEPKPKTEPSSIDLNPKKLPEAGKKHHIEDNPVEHSEKRQKSSSEE